MEDQLIIDIAWQKKALQVPWMDRRSNLTNIDWVVVALAVGRWVRVVGIFPCLSITNVKH